MKAAMLVALGLCAALAQGQTRPKGPVQESGVLNGARFHIDIPANWNGGLVMWAHGYSPPETPYRIAGEEGVNNAGTQLIPVLGALGYALAQSAYSVQVLAIREGVLETEALRQYFVNKYGKTYPTIFAGNHGGGLIVYAAIEKLPEAYDGAVAFGGIPLPELEWVKERMFDMRLLFDYYFPGLPGSVVDFPDDQTWASVRVQAKKLVDAHPERAKDLLRMYNLRDTDELWRCMGLYTSILKDLYRNRAHGNAFDNRNTIYRGSSDDAKLNREIPRYKSDPKAVQYMRQWATPTCNISFPVLAINSLIDAVVPSQDTHYYDEACNRAGKTDLFVQMWMDMKGQSPTPGPEGFTQIFKMMDEWIRQGKRPAGGELTAGVE